MQYKKLEHTRTITAVRLVPYFFTLTLNTGFVVRQRSIEDMFTLDASLDSSDTKYEPASYLWDDVRLNCPRTGILFAISEAKHFYLGRTALCLPRTKAILLIFDSTKSGREREGEKMSDVDEGLLYNLMSIFSRL